MDLEDGRSRGVRLLLALLGVALVAGISAAFFHFRPVPAPVIAAFPAPAGDRGARDGNSRSEKLWMTLDPSRKFLINSFINKPVFITGDDAWSLQVQLSDEDVQMYLADRATRGFNAIWVGLVDNTYSDHPPRDFYGNAPFNGQDFTNENPAYWDRVDRTLSWAARHGITVFASPAFVGYDCTNGYCESYRRTSADELVAYGRFLGKRYRDASNLVWVIGGDADPKDKDVQAKLHALAIGIRDEDRVHLMTAEGYRGFSAQDIWGETSWLDLNALYLKPDEIPAKANAAYLSDKNPVFLFEDWYEGDHSLSELGVRREGYWAVLSGCTLGRIFGNYAIWNFSWNKATKDPWKKQLGGPGSVGQSWMGRLFRSREHWKLVPDINHKVLTAGYEPRLSLGIVKESLRSIVYRLPVRPPDALAVAARTSDGQTIIAYIPSGNRSTIAIDMAKISDPQSLAQCWWFNPRDGSDTLIGSFGTNGSRDFTAPDGDDWVLVIDGQSSHLDGPAKTDL